MRVVPETSLNRTRISCHLQKPGYLTWKSKTMNMYEVDRKFSSLKLRLHRKLRWKIKHLKWQLAAWDRCQCPVQSPLVIQCPGMKHQTKGEKN